MSTAPVAELEEGVHGDSFDKANLQDPLSRALNISIEEVTPAGSKSALQGTKVAVEPQDEKESPIDEVRQSLFGTKLGTMSNTKEGGSSGSFDILRERADKRAEMGEGNS